MACPRGQLATAARLNAATQRGHAMLRVIGGLVVYGFALFGLSVYLRQAHGNEADGVEREGA
jgi:hypothetical protein